MNTELLKEAVGYADGWKIHDSFVRPPFGLLQHVNSIKKECIAALASQLIEQVDAMEEGEPFWVETKHNYSAVISLNSWGNECIVSCSEDGPNRNENSIAACVEFMRGRG